MPNSKLTKAIYQLVEAAVASLGLDLVDVELESQRKGGPRTLRLIIDKRGGVTMDDCSAVSQLVDPIIDSRPDMAGHDYLEVSSPGLSRPLKTDRDLARHQGDRVDIKLYQAVDGQKTYQGTLAPCSEELIAIETDDGTTLAFERSQVAKIQRTVEI